MEKIHSKIVERYKGKSTAKGHDLRIDEGNGEVILWYLYWGEFQGIDDHHHMGIVKVHKENDQLKAGWLRGVDQKPYREDSFSSLDDLLVAIDQKLKNR